MPDLTAPLPPRYLRTPEAARFLSLAGRTLEKHRTYGTGPTYRKIGGRVVYGLDDLKAWADRGTKTSTSDPGAGTVLPARRQAPVSPAHGERGFDWPRTRSATAKGAGLAVAGGEGARARGGAPK